MTRQACAFFCVSNALLHFFFTYCCRLPPCASRLGHLAEHLVAVQRDVFGLLDGLLCHLLAVHVQLDFLRRDGDVQLRGGGRGGWEGTIKQNRICLPRCFGRCQIYLQHVLLAWADLNTRAFEEPFGRRVCFYLQSGITVHEKDSEESP